MIVSLYDRYEYSVAILAQAILAQIIILDVHRTIKQFGSSHWHFGYPHSLPGGCSCVVASVAMAVGKDLQNAGQVSRMKGTFLRRTRCKAITKKSKKAGEHEDKESGDDQFFSSDDCELGQLPADFMAARMQDVSDVTPAAGMNIAEGIDGGAACGTTQVDTETGTTQRDGETATWVEDVESFVGIEEAATVVDIGNDFVIHTPPGADSGDEPSSKRQR